MFVFRWMSMIWFQFDEKKMIVCAVRVSNRNHKNIRGSLKVHIGDGISERRADSEYGRAARAFNHSRNSRPNSVSLPGKDFK